MTEHATQAVSARTNAYYNTEGIMQLRLDTQRLLSDFELFLRGKMVRLSDNDGQIVQQIVSIGKEKANDEGIQGIMEKMHALVNPSTVQGNFKQDKDYFKFIKFVRLEFADMLFINRIRWKIEKKDYNAIIDACMNLVEMYLTRPLDNEERNSYSSTMRTTESNTLQEKKGGFLGFGA